jgi:hypothetical protein
MSIAVMKQALEFIAGLGRNHWGNRRAVMDNLRAAIEQYDQTALELCEECGWRAMIPGEGCLTCARQKATPVWIQRNHLENAQREPSMCRVEPTKRLPDFVPLYAAPSQWVGLTTQEILEIVDDHTEIRGSLPMLYRDQAVDLARDIEAKLKERNAY